MLTCGDCVTYCFVTSLDIKRGEDSMVIELFSETGHHKPLVAGSNPAAASSFYSALWSSVGVVLYTIQKLYNRTVSVEDCNL